jgi:hypothetical protein
MLTIGLLVMATTLGGFWISVFVIDSDIPIVAGLLGTGGGAMLGSFIAAIATDEPLIGQKTDMAEKRRLYEQSQRRRAAADRPTDDRDSSKAL